MLTTQNVFNIREPYDYADSLEIPVTTLKYAILICDLLNDLPLDCLGFFINFAAYCMSLFLVVILCNTMIPLLVILHHLDGSHYFLNVLCVTTETTRMHPIMLSITFEFLYVLLHYLKFSSWFSTRFDVSDISIWMP